MCVVSQPTRAGWESWPQEPSLCLQHPSPIAHPACVGGRVKAMEPQDKQYERCRLPSSTKAILGSTFGQAAIPGARGRRPCHQLQQVLELLTLLLPLLRSPWCLVPQRSPPLPAACLLTFRSVPPGSPALHLPAAHSQASPLLPFAHRGL